MNFSPVDASTKLLPGNQTAKQKSQIVLSNAVPAICLYKQFGNNISLGRIIQSTYGIQNTSNTTIATGLRIDGSTILIPGHSASFRHVQLVDYKGSKCASNVRQNFYPEQDMALVTNFGKSYKFDYYAGGAFGQQDFLLFFYGGKLLAKELLIQDGQLLNETMPGLSGGVMVSRDPYGDFKVTGIHVGEGHVLQATDIAKLQTVSIVGPSLIMNEPEIARVGGYKEEARYSFSDKIKTKGFDVIEIDGQGRSSKRKGCITFFNINNNKVKTEFVCGANEPDATKSYHRDPNTYYETLAKKIQSELEKEPSTFIKNKNIEFKCHLDTDSSAKVLSIESLEKTPESETITNKSAKNIKFMKKMKKNH